LKLKTICIIQVNTKLKINKMIQLDNNLETSSEKLLGGIYITNTIKLLIMTLQLLALIYIMIFITYIYYQLK
jgi:hypothetical protein